jgi:putative SOS response-associated peptidase YedK
MCNEYLKTVAALTLAERFSEYGIPLRIDEAASNRPLDEPIRPTERATILRPLDPARPAAGLEMVDLRWWLVPAFHKGPVKDWRAMSTNARIETVDTSPAFKEAYRRRRCLVPLTSFIEYSEPPGWKKGQPKQRNEISWAGDDIRFFAGLWERATPADFPECLESFAFITGPAPADMAAIHDRGPPVLTLDQGMAWLDLEGSGKASFETPPPAGTFEVQIRPREQLMSPEMRRLL